MTESPFRFELDGSVLGAGSAEELLLATAQADVLVALTEDGGSFPGRTVELAEISVAGEGERDFLFGDGGDRVSFRAGLAAAARMVVTPDRETVLAGLPLAEPIAEALAAEPEVPGVSYALLTWGYDLVGAARGAVALGGATRVLFGVDAKKVGGFAVVHRFRRETAAREVLATTVKAWRLPRQVETVDQLPPGTWLVTEVEGSLELELGVEVGYDFSWIRETELSGLSGDIALRVETGLSATLGFEAAGRYALVLRRDSLEESDRRLRLQLFKQSKQGWGFALNADATVQADLGDFAPESLDELLRAVLGVEGRQQLVVALETWRDLEGEVAALLWSRLGDEPAIESIRGLAKAIGGSPGDDEALRSLLGEHLADGAFLGSPAGRWLQAATSAGLADLLADSAAASGLRRAAARTLDVLDGDEVEKVLGRLKGEIEEVFRLDRLAGAIEAAIEASDPERLDAWARQRLARFLDDQPTVKRLEEVVDALVAFRKRGSDLYQRTLDAIQRRYQLSFAASYQRATTREALVDVEFDFGHPDAPGGLADLLKAAIDGRLNRLFVESIPGVTLRRGSLSHRIDRRADIALDLPWYDRTERHVARSVATVEAVEDDGRLLLYEGTATDRVSVATAKVLRDSQLTIVTRLERCPGVRNHIPGSVRCSYSLRQALTQARVSLVESQLRAFVDSYFPEAFPADGDGETSGSFRNWLASLDRAVEDLEGNGLGNLGNTLLTMHVSVAPEVASAWLDAPAAGHEAYRQMSLRLQERLKELIPRVYFQDLRRCSPNAVDAAVLHAYAALPPSLGVRLRNDGKLVPTQDGELHWDLQDERLLRALLSTGRAERRLAETAQRFRALLAQQPGLSTQKKELASDRGFAQQVWSAALPGSTPRPTLVSLLHSEREIVAAAARAGAAMARFREEAPERPREAVAALAEFGAALSRAFHKELGSLYLKDGLRPFGTLLFSEAAAAIQGGPRPETSALLQLVILRQGVTFPPEGFPDHERPAPGDVLLAQNLVDR